MQVGIDIPSIKASLSDREYRLITSVAGDNFSEPLRLPQAAVWLEDMYTEEAMEDAESEPAASMQVCLITMLITLMHLYPHSSTLLLERAWSCFNLGCTMCI